MDTPAKVGEPLISFRNVVKTYGAGDAVVHALAAVSFTIRAGEFVAIMGPSGSGKSTAMNMIGCLDTPTSGEYLFQGIDVGALTRDQRALLRCHYLGFVFQGFNLLARTSAIENVELPLIYRGMKLAQRRPLAVHALERVGLANRAGHTPSELSGGQQQRVAIARALVTDPAVLLADEPTGNLDTKTSREIMDLLTSLNRDQGITVIMVTHEPDMAAYAHRVIRFLDGRIESDAPQLEAAPC
ncbi:MAG: macrolide transporter ATP-binding protein [Hyphomicrobiales bacterium]|nr:macrolide transporter ATP-binding protein [Hyphomicrobiales bacterium]